MGHKQAKERSPLRSQQDGTPDRGPFGPLPVTLVLWIEQQ